MTAASDDRSDGGHVGVAFVMPALDEREHVGRAIESVFEHADRWRPTVVVVDNGSRDGTPEIARASGARVLVRPDLTVGGLRNAGVAEVDADVLVFLDADVSLTGAWSAGFEQVVEHLRTDPLEVTGSRCRPVARDDFLTRYWFSRLPDSDTRYVNSGHMITSQLLFDVIGGFDESRSTGEDHDFCLRAASAGARVRNRPDLPAVHHDYPATLSRFVLREAWHGEGDVASLRAFATSRVAIASFALLALLAVAVLVSVALLSLWPVLIGATLVGAALIALTLSKFGAGTVRQTLAGAALYGLYLAGRTLSLVRSARRFRTAPGEDEIDGPAAPT